MIVHHPRLTAGLLASATAIALGGAALLATPAATAAPVQAGLFGAADPTYDGVFRQSLSLLAYVAADQTPPKESVDWLLDQQCPDGGFQAFRESTTSACLASDPVAYAGEDTNSSGMAAAALQAIGQTAAASRALTWLDAAQNADGGFPYFVGGDSDANSTAAVLFATNNAGRAPSQVARGATSAADFLAALAVGCAGAAAGDDGGFAFQDYGTGLVANDAASVQASLALTGVRLPFVAPSSSPSVPRADCPTPTSTPSTPSVGDRGAGYIARLLDTYAGAVPQFDFTAGKRLTGTVSAGDTAWAALSLAAAGVGSAQLSAALDVLAKETAIAKAAAARSSAGSAATDQPGLLGLTALATAAAGGSADSVDALVDRIGATVRVAATPSASPTPSPSTTPSPSATAPTDSPTDSPAVTPTLPDTGSSTLALLFGLLGLAFIMAGAATLTLTRRRGAST